MKRADYMKPRKEVEMIKTYIKYLGACTFLLAALILAGCNSSGQGKADAVETVENSYEEDCAFCHSEGRIADVSEAHEIPESGNLMGEITGVTITGGQTIIMFNLFDPANPLIPMAGVAPNSIRFALAKLDPATGNWQNYINATETRDSGDPGTTPDGTTVTQGTAERASTSNGVFTDMGDGSYSYRLSFDITMVTSPVAVSYDPSVLHRVAMQVSGNVTNAVFDFVPNGSGAGQTRSIVTEASCNECHLKLRLHGGDRIATDYCVTCHNPGSMDAHSGNSVDFKVMIHKIHRGAELPSVQTGTNYAIYGFNNNEHDYSDVEFPQDIRNCTKCHNSADTATADGGNWMNNPSIAACGACHDDISFAESAPEAMTPHPGGPQANDNQCTICHGAVAIAESHEIPESVAAERFQYTILSITNTAPGNFPTVTFSVSDPTNGNAPYDILSDPEFTASGGASRLVALIGWETLDYTNTGSTYTPAQPVSINLLDSEAVSDNFNGTYTVISPIEIPEDAVGSGVVAIEGHPAVPSDPDEPATYDLRVPATSVIQYFAITDVEPVSRRDVVDLDQCTQCHKSISLHGSNRNNELRLCVICHNANATDINRRPTDGSTIADGKVEEAIDFKYMIHSIHGAELRQKGIVVYGFGGSVNDFSEVLLPAGEDNLRNCRGCHVSGGSTVPIDSNALPTTTRTNADLEDPGDDTNTTPTASVCSACHDSIEVKTHMADNGGSFNFVRFTTDSGDNDDISCAPGGTQPPGHTTATDCCRCHGS